MNKIKKTVPAVAIGLAMMFVAAGCTDGYEQDCANAGGKVSSDRESCGTKTETTGSGTTKKTRKVTKYKTERECKDSQGREVLPEDDGFCS